jgi:hypothetical protein
MESYSFTSYELDSSFGFLLMIFRLHNTGEERSSTRSGRYQSHSGFRIVSHSQVMSLVSVIHASASPRFSTVP